MVLIVLPLPVPAGEREGGALRTDRWLLSCSVAAVSEID